MRRILKFQTLFTIYVICSILHRKLGSDFFPNKPFSGYSKIVKTHQSIQNLSLIKENLLGKLGN
jgi:hypothetical protein